MFVLATQGRKKVVDKDEPLTLINCLVDQFSTSLHQLGQIYVLFELNPQ